MGTTFDLEIDRGAFDRVLNSGEVAHEVNGLARSVARNAQHTTEAGVDLPLVVDNYTTDRRAASVTIAHPAGLATEAKYGTLIRAAAAAGLEVKAR